MVLRSWPRTHCAKCSAGLSVAPRLISRLEINQKYLLCLFLSPPYTQHTVPPVLGMWWCLLQSNESVAGCVERQAADAVAPLLLCPEGKRREFSIG